MTDLSSCPFCGGEAEALVSATGCVVSCSTCVAEGPPWDTKAEAIAAWNRRAAPRTPESTGEAWGLLGRILQDTAEELGCEADNEAILIAIQELKERAALPPSSGWEDGAEAMREKAAVEALWVYQSWTIPTSTVAERIRELPLPPPPSKEAK